MDKQTFMGLDLANDGGIRDLINKRKEVSNRHEASTLISELNEEVLGNTEITEELEEKSTSSSHAGIGKITIPKAAITNSGVPSPDIWDKFFLLI